MQRWQLTAGLAGLALVGAFVAPRLVGLTPDPAPTPPATPPDATVPEPAAPPAPAPELQGHLEVEARLDRTALLHGETQERFLAITVTAPEDLGESFRRPVDLGVVLDASGSMAGRGKIDYARDGAKLLASSMEPGDVYSLVTFGDEATVVVPATEVDDPWTIHHAVDSVGHGGGTNLFAGLTRGAEEIERSLSDDSVGRLVLLSDGHPTTGVKDTGRIAAEVARIASEGVSVSTVGLGLDYNEDLLSRLADLGGGTYDFVDDPRELSAVFADELERTASVVARGTEVSIALPEGVEGLEVIGWEATRTETGWRVPMGDVYAGDARKVIARVRVTAQGTDRMPVASVTAAYDDLVQGAPARSGAEATASVTTRVAEVEASVDQATAVEAVRAWGNEFLVRSTRAYADGRRDEARDLARRSAEVLGEAATTYDNDVLAEDAAGSAEQLRVYDAYDPASPTGKRAVKATKEKYNVQSRQVMK